MSKYFKKAEQDSSSSSDESSADEKKAGQPQREEKKKKYYDDGSDDSDDDKQRVVRTTADKRTDALREVFTKTKNHIKIEDFSALQSDLDEIIAEMEKCVEKVFATDKIQTLPGWVLSNLVALEDCVLGVAKDQQKKMKKDVQQAFTRVKTKLKRYLTETGDSENLFTVQVQKYRENPVDDEDKKADSDNESSDSEASDSGSSSSSSSGSSSDDKPTKTKKETKAAAKGSDDSDKESSSSSSDSGSDSDSDGKESGSGSDSEDSVEEVKKGELPKKYAFLALPHEQRTPEQRRWKWVLFANLPEDMKPFIRDPNKKTQGGRKGKAVKATAGTGGKVTDDPEHETIVLLDDRDLDFTKLENVDKILNKYKNQ